MLRAVTGKRIFTNRVQRIGIAAAAIGILAIGVVGAVALRGTEDGRATRVTVSTMHALPSVAAYRYAFSEEDAWQPPSVDVVTQADAVHQYSFGEEDAWQPTSVDVDVMATVTGAARLEANGFPNTPR